MTLWQFILSSNMSHLYQFEIILAFYFPLSFKDGQMGISLYHPSNRNMWLISMYGSFVFLISDFRTHAPTINIFTWMQDEVVPFNLSL